MTYRLTGALMAACLGLAACAKPSVGSIDQSVIGVDLGRDGPFRDVTTIRLNAVAPDGATTAEQAAMPRLTIARGAQGDSGEAANILDNTSRPFLTGVGYLPLSPVVAETNAQARSYWLIALNMTRTPNRSEYLLLRYPHGTDIRSGLSSDAFEAMELKCYNLDVARLPADYWAPQKEGEPERPEPRPDPKPEAGACEFNSLAEARTMSELMLKRYDQIRHYDSAPALDWQKVHVEVK